MPEPPQLDFRTPPPEIGSVTVGISAKFFDGRDSAEELETEIPGFGKIPFRVQTAGFADPLWESAALAGMVVLMKSMGRRQADVQGALSGVLASLDILWNLGSDD